MAFYPQNFERTEHVNGVLNLYLKNLVGADQQNRADYEGQAEFSCDVINHALGN